MVDEFYPYTAHLSDRQRKRFLQLVNPDVPEHQRERAVRQIAEANDRSDIAQRRREMRSRQLSVANDKVHHMDIYFLFGLMDACDMGFERE
jgi:hypothetical protein